MWTNLMDSRSKRLLSPVESIKRKSCNLVGKSRKTLCVINAPNTVCQHKLSPVQESKSLFRSKFKRLPAEHLINLFSGISLALVSHFSHPKKRKGHICQRRQIT